MPFPIGNRTTTQVKVDQSAAGTTDLVAAPGAGQRVYVTAIVLYLATGGTVQFTEGTGPTTITGNMPVAANGPMVIIGNSASPVLQTNTAASKLSVVSTGGALDGWITYFVATE